MQKGYLLWEIQEFSDKPQKAKKYGGATSCAVCAIMGVLAHVSQYQKKHFQPFRSPSDPLVAKLFKKNSNCSKTILGSGYSIRHHRTKCQKNGSFCIYSINNQPTSASNAPTKCVGQRKDTFLEIQMYGEDVKIVQHEILKSAKPFLNQLTTSSSLIHYKKKCGSCAA